MRKGFTLLVTAFALAFATSTSFGNELYKWVDSFGNVTYTDSPPPDSAKASEEVALGDVELVDTQADEAPTEITDELLESETESGAENIDQDPEEQTQQGSIFQ